MIPYSVPEAFANLLDEFLENGTAPPVAVEEWAAQLQSMAVPAAAEATQSTTGGLRR